MEVDIVFKRAMLMVDMVHDSTRFRQRTGYVSLKHSVTHVY